MSEKRRRPENAGEKVELAKKIANQSQRVSEGYESVETYIFRFIRYLSSAIDSFIFNSKHLVLISLVLAVIMFFAVSYDSESSLLPTLSSAKTISGVAVSARYNDEIFEVSGLPSSCNVVITGDASNVSSAATKTGYCAIDLEGYTEGTHTVEIVGTGYGNNVNVAVSPSEATITLYRKETAEYSLSYDFINTNQLDSRYVLGTPEFVDGNDKVNIRASHDTLYSIAMVKALVDVSGQTKDFETEAQLVAYDRSGNVVNAVIDPSTVKVKVSVTSPSKTVPIELIINGEMPDGLAIDTIEMDRQTTEIYASESVLSGVESVYAEVDASSLTSGRDVTVKVVVPSAVSYSEGNAITLLASLAEAVTKQLYDIPISYRNNDNGYGATDVETPYVSVTVSGSQANIDKISENDITVFIDVAGLEPGTYDLPIEYEIDGNAYISCILDKVTLHITLVEQ